MSAIQWSDVLAAVGVGVIVSLWVTALASWVTWLVPVRRAQAPAWCESDHDADVAEIERMEAIYEAEELRNVR
jgi:hypothetical protein